MNIVQHAIAAAERASEGEPYELVIKTITGETLVGPVRPLGSSGVAIKEGGEEVFVAVAHIVTVKIREA